MAYVVLLVADVADGRKADKQRGEHKDKQEERHKLSYSVIFNCL